MTRCGGTRGASTARATSVTHLGFGPSGRPLGRFATTASPARARAGSGRLLRFAAFFVLFFFFPRRSHNGDRTYHQTARRASFNDRLPSFPIAESDDTDLVGLTLEVGSANAGTGHRRAGGGRPAIYELTWATVPILLSQTARPSSRPYPPSK